MARSSRARTAEVNFWPGFVDALSTLLLVMIFVISIFVVAQFYLGQAISSRDDALARLNARIASLTEQLGLAEARNDDLSLQLSELTATLAQTQDALQASDARAAGLAATLAAAEGRAVALASDLEAEQALTEERQNEIALLNQQLAALRQQLASLQEALEAAEAKDKEQQAEIVNLGERLNAALAQKVQELATYRSQFFEALTKALGDRTDVRVVGDRFVFESDILFGPCEAALNTAGQAELNKLAGVLLDIADDIPAEIAWVLRVDGHADATALGPECRKKFASNWELSSARGISVVQHLIGQGVPPGRLMAAGFGEHQPIVQGRSISAFRQNRRIEFKLTER